MLAMQKTSIDLLCVSQYLHGNDLAMKDLLVVVMFKIREEMRLQVTAYMCVCVCVCVCVCGPSQPIRVPAFWRLCSHKPCRKREGGSSEV